MRRYAFAIALLGMIILAYFILNGRVVEVKEAKDLDGLTANQKVHVLGEVIGERKYGKGSLMELDNELVLVCDCYGFEGKKVDVLGLVEDYTGEKRIKVLRIVVLE